MKRLLFCILALYLGCQLKLAQSADLLNAVQTGDLAATQVLVNANNADIRAKDEHGWDALMFATRGGHVEIVKFLLSQGADPNTKENASGNWCLDKNCTSWQGLSGRPVLTIAVQRGHPEIVRLLIEAGADFTAKNRSGHTVLREAWHPDIVQILLDKGLDPNYVGKDPSSPFAALGTHTPLIIAAQGGNLDVLRLLLKAGANPNARGALGGSALHNAAKFGFARVIEPLIDAGAEIDARDPFGKTALRIAAENGHAEFVKVLLAAGADATIPDNQGRTALTAANLAGSAETVHLLENAGERR